MSFQSIFGNYDDVKLVDVIHYFIPTCCGKLLYIFAVVCFICLSLLLKIIIVQFHYNFITTDQHFLLSNRWLDINAIVFSFNHDFQFKCFRFVDTLQKQYIKTRLSMKLKDRFESFRNMICHVCVCGLIFGRRHWGDIEKAWFAAFSILHLWVMHFIS